MEPRGRRDIGAAYPFRHYDRRRYRTVSVEEGYASWSRIYGDFEDRLDINLLEASSRLRPGLRGAQGMMSESPGAELYTEE